eukprot:m.194453 g.194453  ORF g.194453 m.194453 type:complete len:536 (-) comp10618_c3_seq1:1470-3077(-)
MTWLLVLLQRHENALAAARVLSRDVGGTFAAGEAALVRLVAYAADICDALESPTGEPLAMRCGGSPLSPALAILRLSNSFFLGVVLAAISGAQPERRLSSIELVLRVLYGSAVEALGAIPKHELVPLVDAVIESTVPWGPDMVESVAALGTELTEAVSGHLLRFEAGSRESLLAAYVNPYEYIPVGTALFLGQRLVLSHLNAEDLAAVGCLCRAQRLLHSLPAAPPKLEHSWTPLATPGRALLSVRREDLLLVALLERAPYSLSPHQELEDGVDGASLLFLSHIMDSFFLSGLARQLRREAGTYPTMANPDKLLNADAALEETRPRSKSDSSLAKPVLGALRRTFSWGKLSKRRATPPADVVSMAATPTELVVPLSEAGGQNTVFHFAALDCKQNVVLCSPNNETGRSARLFQQYQAACEAIRQVLDRQTELWRDDTAPAAFEHGLLFRPQNQAPLPPPAVARLTNKRGQQKNEATGQCAAFWVVGRRVPDCASRPEAMPRHSDFFVCYLDSVPQLAVELAFRLQQGRGPCAHLV